MAKVESPISSQRQFSSYNNKRVLITGGLGFIGSNIALKLVTLGAKVTLVDNLLPEHGANAFNITSIKDKVILNLADVRDEHIMGQLIKDQNYIFHFAGQASHVLSLSNPYPDLDINIKGTVSILEAIRKHNPNAIFIYGGTRGQYGKAVNPAKETDTSTPTGIHEISHLAAEQIIQTYFRNFNIPVILTRLTNIYGERSQMLHDKYCVVNWFIRLALENKPIPVFGKGKIIRDFLYINDCIDALLMLALQPKAYGEVFNIASGKPTAFMTLVELILKTTNQGSFILKPFSVERKAQEPGDFWADITKITQLTTWQPQISLERGIKNTVRYYQQNHTHYGF